MEFALLIVRAIMLIAVLGFIGTFIWAVIKKWNKPSLITHLVISIVIFISSIIKLILEIDLDMSWINSAMIIVIIAVNIAINLTIYSEKFVEGGNENE